MENVHGNLSKKGRPAIFLDRDGTLNEDVGYLYQQEKWRWLEGAPSALAIFAAAGYALVVVTNQSGIARGYYTEDAVQHLHAFANSDLRHQGHSVQIDAFYYCPHHPDFSGKCTCRKPEPGLLLSAAQHLHLDLTRSWMIGDKARDVLAGLHAGCQSILLASATEQEEKAKVPHALYMPTLLDAAKYITSLQ